MNRFALTLLLIVLLLAPGIGSANPSGVGGGEFDAQCGGACHGDADMNRSSNAVISISAPDTVYEGLLTSVTVHIESIQTTQTGLIGVFLLSDLTGAQDTPADAGWDIVSNSEGEAFNYLETTVSAGTTSVDITWTLKAPPVGTYTIYGAIHHGNDNGDEAPYFGVSETPLSISVLEVPENLPRLADSFSPSTQRDLGEITTITAPTEFVTDLEAEWRMNGGEATALNATEIQDGIWSFELPTSIQPSMIEWRVILAGDGPNQTSPWFQLRSDEPSWAVDNTLVYGQSIAMLVAIMAGFMALQTTLSRTTAEKERPELLIPPGGEF